MKRPITVRIAGFTRFYLFLELLAFLALEVTARVVGNPYRPNISALNTEQIAALTDLVSGADRGGRVMSPDAVLGWRPVKEANSAGMRDRNEYDIEAPDSVIRVSAFGDSFTYGSDVTLEESWGQQLMKRNPSIQLFNFGSGAYGLDQAYLRYNRDKLPYKADIVLLGYMSENLARNVNVFRPFYSPAYGRTIFTKPRFKLLEGELVLLPNPVSSARDHKVFLENHERIIPELGSHDYHYQTGYNKGPLDFSPLVRLSRVLFALVSEKLASPIFRLNGMYNTDSEAFQVTTRIFDQFYSDVLADGSLPVVLVFPDTHDHLRSRAGRPRRYQPLLDYFEDRGYPCIDILNAIEPLEADHSIEDLTVEWGHFSPLGNRIIAAYIESYLKEKYSLDVENVHLAVEAERRRLGTSGGVSWQTDRQ